MTHAPNATSKPFSASTRVCWSELNQAGRLEWQLLLATSTWPITPIDDEMVRTDTYESGAKSAPFDPDGAVDHGLVVHLLCTGERARGCQPDSGRQRFVAAHRVS